MNVAEIHKELDRFSTLGKKLFVTSSFQTHSIPLLHILSNSQVMVDVLFINTGFHFPETIRFKKEIAKLLSLHIIDVTPFISKNHQKDEDGQFYFVSDTDYCCYLNKTQPLETYLKEYDVWINGVRAEQSLVRKNFKTIEDAPFNTLRFHPMLQWTSNDIYNYRKKYHLPEHPLDKQGYQSIGCAPCTRKMMLEGNRDNRWFGQNKTECGLHTQLINK